ncbi:MAG: DNA integrity scanning protein DisA nucleotide-binding domain protein [Deltaproteobacteria bacterium]|nr:DNA integrity scanning protein DisA nucleotide-binding domain protein [Deltaproteobacteria bacterium]
MDMMSSVQAELLRAAAAMVVKKEFDHLLYIGDLPLPDDLIKAKSNARRKLVQAITSDVQRQVIEAMGVETIPMPTYDIQRQERFKMALVAGIAAGLLKDGEVVLGVIGRGPTSYPDTMMIVTIGGDNEGSVNTGFGIVGTDRIPSTILEAVFDLGVEIGRDGWEGHPLGTLLVVGDSAAVMEKSRQLTLNPFQGYSENEKNILNPAVRDAIRNFAVLDGGFVIRDDGVVLAAGRYIKVDDPTDLDVHLGLGSRHVAACAISKSTNAIAVVVSETSGVTRVFQSGRCVLEIQPEQRTRRGAKAERDEPPLEIVESQESERKDQSKVSADKTTSGRSKEPKEKDPKAKEPKKG